MCGFSEHKNYLCSAFTVLQMGYMFQELGTRMFPGNLKITKESRSSSISLSKQPMGTTQTIKPSYFVPAACCQQQTASNISGENIRIYNMHVPQAATLSFQYFYTSKREIPGATVHLENKIYICGHSLNHLFQFCIPVLILCCVFFSFCFQLVLHLDGKWIQN